MPADLDCPHCWGLGEALREARGRNGALVCWPCPMGCQPGGAALVRTTVTPERAAKAARKMLAKAASLTLLSGD